MSEMWEIYLGIFCCPRQLIRFNRPSVRPTEESKLVQSTGQSESKSDLVWVYAFYFCIILKWITLISKTRQCFKSTTAKICIILKWITLISKTWQCFKSTTAKIPQNVWIWLELEHIQQNIWDICFFTEVFPLGYKTLWSFRESNFECFLPVLLLLSKILLLWETSWEM